MYAGGENVYCSEVEAVLSAHPQVLQAAVFGVPNSVMGEMVHAAVVLRHSCSTPATPQHLITWCHSQLALYKCPTAVHVMEELPTTGSGKVLKKVLRATFTRGSGPAAAAAMTAAVAAEVPESAVPLLAAAAAAAEAAVRAVASCTDQPASDAHVPSTCTSTGENGKEEVAVMLAAVIAQCPSVRMLHYTSDVVIHPKECCMVVVSDWTSAVTKVIPCCDKSASPL